jgi:hypothetical protein
LDELSEIREETGGALRIEDGFCEGVDGVFEWGIGIDPGSEGFGFAGGFEEASLDSLDVIRVRSGGGAHGPGTDDGLIEKKFEAWIGGGLLLNRGECGLVPAVPALDGFGPVGRDLRKDVETGAGIFTAFGVVCGSGEE